MKDIDWDAIADEEIAMTSATTEEDRDEVEADIPRQ